MEKDQRTSNTDRCRRSGPGPPTTVAALTTTRRRPRLVMQSSILSAICLPCRKADSPPAAAAVLGYAAPISTPPLRVVDPPLLLPRPWRCPRQADSLSERSGPCPVPSPTEPRRQGRAPFEVLARTPVPENDLRERLDPLRLRARLPAPHPQQLQRPLQQRRACVRLGRARGPRTPPPPPPPRQKERGQRDEPAAVAPRRRRSRCCGWMRPWSLRPHARRPTDCKWVWTHPTTASTHAGALSRRSLKSLLDSSLAMTRPYDRLSPSGSLGDAAGQRVACSSAPWEHNDGTAPEAQASRCAHRTRARRRLRRGSSRSPPRQSHSRRAASSRASPARPETRPSKRRQKPSHSRGEGRGAAAHHAERVVQERDEVG